MITKAIYLILIIMAVLGNCFAMDIKELYPLFYLEGEKGAETVAEILKDALNDKAEILMSVINWGEIYYIVLRELGEKTAKLYLQTIERYPIKIVAASSNLPFSRKS